MSKRGPLDAYFTRLPGSSSSSKKAKPTEEAKVGCCHGGCLRWCLSGGEALMD